MRSCITAVQAFLAGEIQLEPTSERSPSYDYESGNRTKNETLARTEMDFGSDHPDTRDRLGSRPYWKDSPQLQPGRAERSSGNNPADSKICRLSPRVLTDRRAATRAGQRDRES